MAGDKLVSSMSSNLDGLNCSSLKSLDLGECFPIENRTEFAGQLGITLPDRTGIICVIDAAVSADAV